MVMVRLIGLYVLLLSFLCLFDTQTLIFQMAETDTRQNYTRVNK